MRFAIAAVLLATTAPAFAQTVEKPAALVADGLPPVSSELAVKTRPYLEFRQASLIGWHPSDKSMLIATRFANTAQIHRVATPLADRKQLSFEAEPVVRAGWAPSKGDALVVQKDVGGNEFFQLYTLKDGQLGLLSDGKSRNEMGPWSDDGSLLAYSSTRRNGTDADLYVIDPRNPSTNRMVAEVRGGGWAMTSIAPDNKSAIAVEYKSITNSDLYRLDLATG